MIKSNSEIKRIYRQTLALMSAYRDNELTVPFALKGNLGEFIVWMELNRRYPDHKIDYRGGASPGADIIIDGVRIQVKTRINKREVFKTKSKAERFVDYDSCPTIKKSTIGEKKCDMIVLVCLYMNRTHSKVEKKNIYLFDKSEFRLFNKLGCWSGNSKGDYTIVNVLKVVGTPTLKWKKIIAHYSKPKYRELFKDSMNNWTKLDRHLS